MGKVDGRGERAAQVLAAIFIAIGDTGDVLAAWPAPYDVKHAA